MTDPIEQARIEGHRKGWSEAMQVNADVSFHEGQVNARMQAPSRVVWFIFGAVSAALVMLVVL